MPLAIGKARHESSIASSTCFHRMEGIHTNRIGYAASARFITAPSKNDNRALLAV